MRNGSTIYLHCLVKNAGSCNAIPPIISSSWIMRNRIILMKNIRNIFQTISRSPGKRTTISCIRKGRGLLYCRTIRWWYTMPMSMTLPTITSAASCILKKLLRSSTECRSFLKFRPRREWMLLLKGLKFYLRTRNEWMLLLKGLRYHHRFITNNRRYV